MNHADERLQLPPPPCCRTCANCEQRTTLGVQRSRCVSGHPMHDGCGWFSESTPSIAQGDTHP
jgi:hypothetical protein